MAKTILEAILSSYCLTQEQRQERAQVLTQLKVAILYPVPWIRFETFQRSFMALGMLLFVGMVCGLSAAGITNAGNAFQPLSDLKSPF